MKITSVTFKPVALLLISLSILVAFAIPSIRQRVQILILYTLGEIPDVTSSDIVTLLSPDSGQDLARIIEKKNPHSAVQNPKTTSIDINAGAQRYRNECAQCHAPDGGGSNAVPALVGRAYKNGDSDWAVYRTIRYGVAKTAMPAHPLTSIQVWQLVAYTRALNSYSTNEKKDINQPNVLISKKLPYAELQSIRNTNIDWLTYSGSYYSTRHSNLTSIDSRNIKQLTVKWIHQFKGVTGPVETTPIVRSGVMFITLPDGRVRALNAKNGKLIWDGPELQTSGAVPGQYSDKNRGVAILGDKVFVGTGNAQLLALSAVTGNLLWQSTVADAKKGYYISGAPLVYRDLVVTGVGTMTGIGINGGRGFIAAYDVNTGKQRWKFYTIPGKGEIGNETWAGDSWRQGGAATWLTGSYDPNLDILYWGVGNPKPDYNKTSRRGDNLYSNCVVAVQGSSGKLLWHFQFTPEDDRDWDANQIPILVDRINGKEIEKLILWANRNGFYYVLNRETGRFIYATPFAKQTWAKGIDSSGRPIPNTKSSQARRGVLIYPGNAGATNWWSPSFDSTLNLVFVPTLEQGMVFFPDDIDSWPTHKNRSLFTAVRALDASTGKLVWERRHLTRVGDRKTGGVLSTKGGVLFGSDQSTFFTLDSKTGGLLWSFETGGDINASPITFGVGEEQFVVIAAGESLIAFGLPSKQQTKVK